MSYVFELGTNASRDRKVLARSNIVQTPKVRRERDFERLPRTTKTLLELSGYSDYLSTPKEESRGSRILPMGKE